MTNEELAVRIQQGEAELVAQLWAQTEAFVRCRARDAMLHIPPSHGCSVEDLVQSGYLALSSAIETYVPDRSSFITWLGYYLQNEFAAAGGYRGTKRHPLDDALSLDAPVSSDGTDEDGTLLDIVADTHPDGKDEYATVDEAIYQEQLHRVLDRAVGKLPAEQADVLRARYWAGVACSEIAQEKGVPVERLRKIEQAGLRTLRTPAMSSELRRYLDENTNTYAHVGLGHFMTSGVSSVEYTVLRREDLARRWVKSKTTEDKGA